MRSVPIKLTTYELNLPIQGEMNIAVISDLHERPYNSIVKILKTYNLDLILLPGDTLERHDEMKLDFKKDDIDRWQSTSSYWKGFCYWINKLGLNRTNDLYAVSNNGIEFIKEASKLSKVILSVGNHEWFFTKEDLSVFEEYDITALDNKYISICVKDNVLNIGGLSTRYNLDCFKKFSEQKNVKILLCHHPELYLNKVKYEYGNKIDLCISGHAHRGQIRLFNRGVYAPGLGFFSKFSKGIYENFFVTSGIANTAFFPRINNPSEICILHVIGGRV